MNDNTSKHSAVVVKRKVMSTAERKSAFFILKSCLENGVLPAGSYAIVAGVFEVSLRTIFSLWKKVRAKKEIALNKQWQQLRAKEEI